MRYQTYRPPFWEPDPPDPVIIKIAGYVPAIDSDSDEEFEIIGTFYEDTNVLDLEHVRSSKRGWLYPDDPPFGDRKFEEHILDMFLHPSVFGGKYQVMKMEEYYYDGD